MAVTVTITHPSQADDAEFEVPGAGMATNGKAYDLDEEQEAAFVARTGMSVRDYYKDTEYVKVTGRTEVTPANDKKGGE